MKLHIASVVDQVRPTNPVRTYEEEGESKTIVRPVFNDGVIESLVVIEYGNGFDLSNAGHFLELFEFFLDQYVYNGGEDVTEINMSTKYHAEEGATTFAFTFKIGG